MAGRVKLQSHQSGRTGPKPTAILLGFGYCARALYPHLITAGYRVVATRRSVDADLDIETLPFDGTVTDAVSDAIKTANIILSSIPPGPKGDPVLSALAHRDTRATWVGYLSATSVYGDRRGQWAFEDEPLYPTLLRGRRRVEAELSWLETGWPVHIFRLAGIYGPKKMGLSRHPFARIKSGQARAIIKPGHIVNRIHVDDIARAVLASIARPNPAQIYNVADGHPAPPQDVLDYAAQLIGAPPPRRTDISNPALSPMMRSFYAETKRIDITRAQTELGWTPLYPTYRDGLAAIMKADKIAPL